METPGKLHRSIMVNEIIDLLLVQPGKVGGAFADLTFGEGGHTDALLDAGAGKVIGVDRDQEALARYQTVGKYREDSRLHLIHGRMTDFAAAQAPDSLDGIVADLGVSTRQLLTGERGFSFGNAGPLDMRMDRTGGETLRERLEAMTVEELVPYLEDADLHPAKKLAQRLLDAVNRQAFETTLDLAKFVSGEGKRHPATQLFLAMRMMVNEEMTEVREGLRNVVAALKPGGRIAVLSFHSTEDRWVKRTFALLAGRCVCERRICDCPRKEIVVSLLKKPALPSRDELRMNPRSRSAKLRCVEKIVDSIVK